MTLIALVAGLVVLSAILWDTFETVVLPRRVTRRLRLARVFYSTSWRLWAGIAQHLRATRRENYLAVYGPLSLLLLFALWAAGLIVGFGLLYLGLSAPMRAPEGPAGVLTTFYMSGTTFFTLGLGDVTPPPGLGRLVAVVEGGTGFGFLGLVISYVPVMYQAFSRRETTMALLDARAGSPPTGLEFLRRHHSGDHPQGVEEFLHEWEHWAAELLESHLSYPILGYFRSQHERESWVAAVTVVLDTCALILAGVDGVPVQPARFTFAMARHAVVDLSQVYNTPPRAPDPDRLPLADLTRLRAALVAAGVPLREGATADRKLAKLRGMYEPYVAALAAYLQVTLPPWLPPAEAVDNWQATAWDRAPGLELL